MSTVRVKTVIQKDGELRVSNLPFRKGDEVEAIVIMRDNMRAEDRQRARQRFLDRANASKFHSTTNYPSRDELHERD